MYKICLKHKCTERRQCCWISRLTIFLLLLVIKANILELFLNLHTQGIIIHYRILNWIEWVEFYSPHQNNQNFLINIIMIKVISWLLDYLLFSSRRVLRSNKRRYCASRGWDRYITKISKTTDIMKVWVPKVKVYICKV